MVKCLALEDTEMQVVIVGAGRADLVAQTKADMVGMGLGLLALKMFHCLVKPLHASCGNRPSKILGGR